MESKANSGGCPISGMINQNPQLMQSMCAYQQQQVMGCPFLSKNKADDDPQGKNLARGYPYILLLIYNIYSLKYISKLEHLFIGSTLKLKKKKHD